MTLSPSFKALVVSLFFLVLASYRSVISGLTPPLALTLFYTVLCLNTYYSIKVFAALTNPWSISQNIIDVLLVIIYSTLAWYLADVSAALTLTVVLFGFAFIKYVILPPTFPSPQLLFRKKIIDGLGFIGALIIWFCVIVLHIKEAVWVWTAGFILVNIYILWLKPLYVKDLDNI